MDIADRFRAEEELSSNVRGRFYIGGQWVFPETDALFSLISPVTEEVQTELPAGSIADMAKALDAADAAFQTGPWPRLTPAERAAYLCRVADEIRARLPLFKRLWPAQIGAPLWMSEGFVPSAPAHFDFFAGLADSFAFEEERETQGGYAKVLREPVGVCALIVPWNSPLFLLTQKLAPALLSGCTVVVKPSPEAPIDALLVAECVEAAGIPAGVVNVVPADRETGDWLIRQPQISKVSFTGSVAAGRHIAAVCADRIARVSLELGGKSASIICEDADISEWLESAMPFTMPLAGQVCFSQTRILVPHSRHKEIVEAFADAMSARALGDPWELSTYMGPVANAVQRDRVLNYIDIAKKEGARAVIGGEAAAGFNRGFFIEPTIFEDVTSEMRVAQEEVFGPVVCIIDYETDDDAIRIANESNFGLSGTVYSRDARRAEMIARQVRTGNVSINGLQLDPGIPFGGYKQSGIGREAGPEGLQPYLETKAIYFS